MIPLRKWFVNGSFPFYDPYKHNQLIKPYVTNRKTYLYYLTLNPNFLWLTKLSVS